jgi:hypothetical protein
MNHFVMQLAALSNPTAGLPASDAKVARGKVQLHRKSPTMQCRSRGILFIARNIETLRLMTSIKRNYLLIEKGCFPHP